MKWARCIVVLVCLSGLGAFGAPRLPGLPSGFDGWHKTQSTTLSHAGWNLPAAQAAAMQEYGLETVEHDRYSRSGHSLAVEAYRFQDARGAYGAFTYFRPGDFRPISIGPKHALAASNGGDVWFTRGDWLVHLHMDQPGSVSAYQLRAFASAIPASPDAAIALPNLPQFLPSSDQVPSSLRYAEGPAAFAASCGWLPANRVGFNLSAETALAAYDLPNLPPGAQLLVISYPTPQMARTRLPQLSPMVGGAIRRSGSFLILVHGLTPQQAAPLLHAVNYDADLTLVPPKYVGLEGLPALIIAIALLCVFVIGVSLVLGLLTGVVSAWLDRILPGGFRLFQPSALVRLHLGEGETSITPMARRRG